MALFYSMPSPHGHHYYDTAQLAAFAVYVGLLLGQGYRRGYAARAWLPLVAAATLALVLGCQLVCLPPDYWAGWLRGDAEAIAALADGPRSIVGGALASWVVLLMLRRPLGFRGWGVFDAFAGPLAWALAVQSVGCVLAGCCWGEATAGGWGVAYGPGTPAYAAQLAQGLIGPAATHTLALVPTQLLQLLLCAGAGLVLHRTRHRRWAAGSWHLLGMGLLCAGRLGIELLRDPAAEPLLGAPVAGLAFTRLEWLLLLGAAAQLGLWQWRQRWPGAAPADVANVAPHPAAPALVGAGLLVATAALPAGTLAGAEVAVLRGLLLLVLLAEGRTWLVALGQGVPRLAGLPLAALLAGVLALGVAQAPAPQAAAPAADAADEPDQQPKRSLTFTGGRLGSAYDEDVLENVPQGCSGNYRTPNHTAYYHQTQAAGGEVAYQVPGARAATTVGGGVWVGTETIGLRGLDPYGPFVVAQPQQVLRRPLLDVHLYGEQHYTWFRDKLDFGYRGGLHLGELLHPASSRADTTLARIGALPELMAYIGYRRWIFGQLDAGYGAANAMGSYTARVSVGSGLGQRAGSRVQLGYALSSHYSNPAMGFVSACLRVPGRSALSGLSLEPYYATDFDRHYAFSLALSYRLGLGSQP